MKCPHKSEEKARFRTIDGTCNNVNQPLFGAAGTPFIRVQPADYADEISAPRVAQSEDQLPNARNVSRFVHGSNANRQNPNSPRLTHLAMNWGQFLDHDFTLAGEQHVTCETVHSNESECFNVEVPADDDVFQSRGVTFFELIRDAPFEFKLECSPGPREHINTITAFLDASNVYGSDEEEAEHLRAPDGTMRIMTARHGCPLGDLLPAQTDPEIPCVSKDPNRPCFVAGDERTNENQGEITKSLHSILWLSQKDRSIATFFKDVYNVFISNIYNKTIKYCYFYTCRPRIVKGSRCEGLYTDFPIKTWLKCWNCTRALFNPFGPKISTLLLLNVNHTLCREEKVLFGHFRSWNNSYSTSNKENVLRGHFSDIFQSQALPSPPILNSSFIFLLMLYISWIQQVSCQCIRSSSGSITE